MFSFKCKSHVQEIILRKNMFGSPLKFILGFSMFLIINQNIHTQLCMNVKTHHHHMNYLKLNYSIFLTWIFSIKCLLLKFVSSVWVLFPFLRTPTMTKPSYEFHRQHILKIATFTPKLPKLWKSHNHHLFCNNFNHKPKTQVI